MCGGAAIAAPADDGNSLLPGEPQGGFVSIFNSRTLDGWVHDHAKAQSFSVAGGTIACSGAGDYETILRTTKPYENFELRLEYMLPTSWSESGILFHVPEIGRATRMGFKIATYHHVGEKDEPTIAGSIFGVKAPARDMSKKMKEWNDVRIVMDWPSLKVRFNGELIHDINVEDYEDLKYRERAGFFAFQDIGSRIQFRRLRVKELPAKDKWTPLFNGKDFTGWRELDKCKWEIRPGGIIHAEGATGYQATDKKYQDFEIKATVRNSARANGGIFCRWTREDDKDRGFEIQIRNSPDASHPTGSIYEIERARDDEITGDNEWYVMHIIVKGPVIISRLDGKTVAEIDNFKKLVPGRIALQMHSNNSWVEWKDIMIKELKGGGQ
jgi:hypothetical protein